MSAASQRRGGRAGMGLPGLLSEMRAPVALPPAASPMMLAGVVSARRTRSALSAAAIV